MLPICIVTSFHFCLYSVVFSIKTKIKIYLIINPPDILPEIRNMHIYGETNKWQSSRCSSSMMVEWVNDGILQANVGKMLVNGGEMLLMMVKWVYDHTLLSPSLTSISPSLTSILPSLAWSIPSFAHFTIIEKLHRLL